MEHIFETLDWLDLLALSLACLIPLVILYSFIIFPRLFSLDPNHLEKFRPFLSAFFVLILGISGCSSTITYFELRGLGKIPSNNLILSSLDYSFGLLFVSAIAIIPALYVVFMVLSRFSSLLDNFEYYSSIKSKISSALALLLLISPGLFISYLLYNKTWLTELILGFPIIIGQVDSMDKLAILSKEYPLRISMIFKRLGMSLGIKNYSILGIITVAALLLDIVANTVTILGRQKESSGEVTNEDDLLAEPEIDLLSNQELFGALYQSDYEEFIDDHDIENHELPPITLTDEEFEQFLKGDENNSSNKK
jgi:hypothetical protein